MRLPSSSQVAIAESGWLTCSPTASRDECRQIMGELTADAVDAGMYDTLAADDAEALREARQRPAAG